MKMNVEFESKEELLSFVGMFGGTKDFVPNLGQTAPVEIKVGKDAKQTIEKPKKNKLETKKEEEEPKNETPEVEAEVTGVDETPTEQPKEAEVTEENNESEVTNITKEMVRAICSKAIKAGKAAEVKNIVSKYGASKLPNLKEECYADAYKDVEALL